MPRIRTLSLVGDGIQKNGKEVTKEMLESIVKNFKADVRPPITLGHPEQGADKVAALGRIDNPRIEPSQRFSGKSELVVELHYTDELAVHEDKGEFEGFSAGIYPMPDGQGYYLHHVAALGQLPPAADTATLDLVELSNQGREAMLVLTFSNPQSKGKLIMTDEEKKVLQEMVSAAVKPLADKVEVLEKGNSEKAGADDSKTDGTQQQDKATDAADSKVRKELTDMQETVKSDRISQATELANAKGMSETEFKPLLAMLQKAPAVELCNNAPDGLFASVKAVIDAKPKAAADSALTQPLHFADTSKGNDGQKMSLSQLAAKSKF